MQKNRHMYFRWTPQTARFTFLMVVAIPTAVGYLAYQTQVSRARRVNGWTRNGTMLIDTGLVGSEGEEKGRYGSREVERVLRRRRQDCTYTCARWGIQELSTSKQTSLCFKKPLQVLYLRSEEHCVMHKPFATSDHVPCLHAAAHEEAVLLSSTLQLETLPVPLHHSYGLHGHPIRPRDVPSVDPETETEPSVRSSPIMHRTAGFRP